MSSDAVISQVEDPELAVNAYRKLVVTTELLVYTSEQLALCLQCLYIILSFAVSRFRPELYAV